MLVLIATNESQGSGQGDYSWTVEGELVTPLAAECHDGDRCGCRRGFPGLASELATTTAMIVERPGVTEHDLRDAVYDYLDRGGWIDLLADTAHDDDDEVNIDALVDDMIDEHVEMIELVCASYPVGTIVVRRGRQVTPRSLPTAA